MNQRLERLKLVVQNRRFLLLRAKGQSPNLASQVMGAVLRALPEQWQERFGYRPLLAESFTDPEAYEGTCYKASNWEAVGWSAATAAIAPIFTFPTNGPSACGSGRWCPKPARCCAQTSCRRRVGAE